jgi:hypothetical protein
MHLDTHFQVHIWQTGFLRSRYHLGPVAVTSAVREDLPNVWLQLDPVVRKVIAVEMEGYGLFSGIFNANPTCDVILAKAVQDMGDDLKDDSFRKYGCQLSARWVLAFIRQYPVSHSMDRPRLRRGNEAVEATRYHTLRQVIGITLIFNIFINFGNLWIHALWMLLVLGFGYGAKCPESHGHVNQTVTGVAFMLMVALAIMFAITILIFHYDTIWTRLGLYILLFVLPQYERR